MYSLTAPAVEAVLRVLTSESFKRFIKEYADRIKKSRGKRRMEATEESMDRTIEGLSEKQAEAITLEHIFVNLLDGRMTREQATEIIHDLGYKVNPNPIQWLKKRLARLRQWIVDAVKWVKAIGETLKLKIKSITIDIGLTPRVSITLVPGETISSSG